MEGSVAILLSSRSYFLFLAVVDDKPFILLTCLPATILLLIVHRNLDVLIIELI